MTALMTRRKGCHLTHSAIPSSGGQGVRRLRFPALSTQQIASCINSLAAHNNEIWVGVCGEMAGEPLFAPLLLGMEIDELSAAPSSLSRVKKVNC
jgi:hypothetical protein